MGREKAVQIQSMNMKIRESKGENGEELLNIDLKEKKKLGRM